MEPGGLNTSGTESRTGPATGASGVGSGGGSEGVTGPVLELLGVDIPVAGAPSLLAVRGVDWQVCAGDRWLLCGPARSGKSSVVAVAAGLMRPAAGCHRLFGRDLSGLREHERTVERLKVGVMFGGGGRLFPTLTVLQNLLLPLRYHGRGLDRADGERVGRLLEGLGVERYAYGWPGDLPRAVAHRVALARALVLGPSVLLLDEPTLGLSGEETAWWRAFWSGDAARILGPDLTPGTWVVASSDPGHARDWSGRVAWMEAGRWRVDAVAGAGAGAGEGLRPAAGG